MADRKDRITFGDLRGGRAGNTPVLQIAAPQCAEAINVDFYRAALGRKRSGMSADGVSFSSGGPFTGQVVFLCRHVPGTDETVQEQWAIDSARVVGRKAGGATYAAPTLKDALTGTAALTTAATLNGRLFLAYESASARLHVWDGSTVRRAGLASTAAPTVANTGAGTYAAVLRYYRVRWTQVSGSTILRSSEATPSVSFTPSGAGTAARITQPTPPSEGETHWEVEGSVDNVTFFMLAGHLTGGTTAPAAAIAVGTTTYDDSVVTTSYATYPVSKATGTYTLQKSYRFLAAAENRLLGFGSFTSTDKQHRLEISAVVGSLDEGDAERVNTTAGWYLDLDEHDSGVPTGLFGPIFGNFYATKFRQFWELRPTGDVTRPFELKAISKILGAVGGRAACVGEDATGAPVLYRLTHRGLYEYGSAGEVYRGLGIEDYVLGPTAVINLDATVVGHLLYYPDKRQVWMWWATGSAALPDQGAIYDVTTGGWSRFATGDKISTVASAMLGGDQVFSLAPVRQLYPRLGSSATTNKVFKADDGSTQDDGTSFAASITTPPFEPGGPGMFGEVGEPIVHAAAASGVTLTATVIPDYDSTNAITGTALLTAEGSETQVSRRCQGAALSGLRVAQITIGDASATTATWRLNRLVVPVIVHESESA